MNIVEQIKDLIRQKSNDYQANDPGDYNFWDGHLKYVYQEATDLAKTYGADLEIVQLGALLHDIALLEKVGTKVDHHENGKILAESILREYNYPEGKMQQVLGCVLHHRSSKNAENLEELCVADADILAHFDNIPMLFDAAYNLHKMVGLDNVRRFMRETFEKDFNDLSERTKAEFEPRYRIICDVVLSENEGRSDLNELGEESDLSLFTNIDCVHLRVPDLDSGLAFYRDKLGLKLLWRTEKSCGLGMAADVTELVISTEDYLMVDIKVDDVEKALPEFVQAGGRVEEGPFNIDIGKCAVVADPWGNKYCLLDTTKGTYDVDDSGAVSGVSEK